jgi:hypothetical protein
MSRLAELPIRAISYRSRLRPCCQGAWAKMAALATSVWPAGRKHRRNFHLARLLSGDFKRGEIERVIRPATQGKDKTMRGFIVGALAVAVVVLGYLYWQETRNDVSIKLEAPRISTN